jgi:hypothetical protein
MPARHRCEGRKSGVRRHVEVRPDDPFPLQVAPQHGRSDVGADLGSLNPLS